MNNTNTQAVKVSVAGIVTNDDQFFFSQRGSHARNERGYWEFPGGALEFGETLHDALRREFREEFNIDQLEIVSLLGVYESISDENGDHWLTVVYLVRFIECEPQIMEPTKSSAIGWFALDQLPNPLASLTALEIDDLRKRR